MGGTLEEVATSESEVAAGRHAEQPFCLVAQPGVVDVTRGPEGEPNPVGLLPRAVGIDGDMAERIERKSNARAWLWD